jgi:hypothetical protein
MATTKKNNNKATTQAFDWAGLAAKLAAPGLNLGDYVVLNASLDAMIATADLLGARKPADLTPGAAAACEAMVAAAKDGEAYQLLVETKTAAKARDPWRVVLKTGTTIIRSLDLVAESGTENAKEAAEVRRRTFGDGNPLHGVAGLRFYQRAKRIRRRLDEEPELLARLQALLAPGIVEAMMVGLDELGEAMGKTVKEGEVPVFLDTPEVTAYVQRYVMQYVVQILAGATASTEALNAAALALEPVLRLRASLKLGGRPEKETADADQADEGRGEPITVAPAPATAPPTVEEGDDG